MEMQILREEIALEKQLASGSGEAVVEGSMALPGGLRQETRVLYAGASVTVDCAEALQDRVRVSGKAIFRALYTQGDAQQIRALEATADYTHVMELPGCQGRCAVQVDAAVRAVDASVYSGQMNLRAYVVMRGSAMLTQQVNAVTGLLGVPGLEIQTQELRTQQVSASGRSDALLREEFDLPASLAIADTLFATACAKVEEVSGGEGRAAVSGQVQLEVWHAAEDPAAPLAVTRHTMPFEQTVDLSGSGGEELRAQVQVLDVAVASQPAGEEGRILRAEVQLRAQVQAVHQETLTVLQDAYTTAGDALLLTRESVTYRSGDRSVQAAESGKAVLLLSGGTPPLRQILAVFATPEIGAVQTAAQRLTVEGTQHLTLIGASREDDALISTEVATPFRQTFAAPAQDTDSIRLNIADAQAHAVTSDRVELRYVMELCAGGIETDEATLITDAALVAAEPMNGSIVLYFAQSGDTLWSVAKHYRVPAALLRRLNPEADEALTAGQGIVVWRRTPEEMCVEAQS